MSRAVTRVLLEIDLQPLYFRNPLFDANSTIYETIGFGEFDNLMTSHRCTSSAVTRVLFEIDPSTPIFSMMYVTIGIGEFENLMTSHPIFREVTFSAISCPPRIYILYGVSDESLGCFFTKIVLMTSLPVFHDVTFSGLAYPYQNRHNRSRSKFQVFHQNSDDHFSE